MITIDNLSISADRLTMSVAVTASAGETFTLLNLWSDTTFKNYTNAIDLTSKLAGTNESESFTIEASDLGISAFNGLYFLEFTTNTNTLRTISISELTSYEECKLNRLLKMVYSNDSCLDNDMDVILNIDMLIQGIESAIKFGIYDEALNFLAILKKLCKNGCSTCPQ